MPLRRCYNYDQETGEPLRSSSGILGCPLGSRCSFVHPDSGNWGRAPKSRPKPRYSRDPSPNSTSSYTSTRTSARLPPDRYSRYNDYPELSSRLSDPQGSRSLGARLTDPEDLPLSESLVSRISEPPMPPVGWASHALNDISSSTWGNTQNEDDISWGSSLTTKPKQTIPPSRSIPTAPASIRKAFGSTVQQRTDNQESALPPSVHGPSPTFDKNISIPAPQSPVAGTQPPAFARTSVPLSPAAVKQSPAFSPKLGPQSLVTPKQPTRPLSPTVSSFPSQPLPQQLGRPPSPTSPFRPPPPPPPPPQPPQPPQPSQPSQPPLPPAAGSVSNSPIQRPTLDVRTSSVPLDHPLSTPTATIQSPLALRSHSPDQQHIEAMERKHDHTSPEQKIVTARLRMISRTVWCYIECKKADLAASRVRKERLSYKNHHIGESAQAKLQASVHEADNKAGDAHRRLESLISQFVESELWPTSPPQDSRLELINQQLQELQKQVTDISEKIKVENSSPEDLITAEQIIAERNGAVDYLTQLDSRQDDLENSIDQRLRDLEQKQEFGWSDLSAKAQMAEKQAALDAKLFKEQLDGLAKQYEAFAEVIAEGYKRQADTLVELQRLRLENEELKRRLVNCEERDVRLRSEFQAFRDSFDILKAQQTYSMRESIDQRLLESMKTSLLTQVCDRIEERFSVARLEIESQMTSKREFTARDFEAKYGHVIEFLNQLHGHLHSANIKNNTNGDITHQ